MNKTTIVFQYLKVGLNNYIVDGNSVFVNGWVDWFLLEKFLFHKPNRLSEIIPKSELLKTYEVELELSINEDDNNRWIDFTVLKSRIV
jgi:hypothetical protein